MQPHKFRRMKVVHKDRDTLSANNYLLRPEIER